MAAAPTSTDDYALEPVPLGARRHWLQIAWGTTGATTTLVGLLVGALVTFVAGLPLALLAGTIVMVIGSIFGWALGNVACQTGLSSTMIARDHGFAVRGAAIPAAFFAFSAAGYIAMENLLLYNGLLFFLRVPDTMTMRVIVYGVLAVIWVVLAIYGFRIVARTAAIAQVAFFAVLIYMLVQIVSGSNIPLSEILSFPVQFPPDALTRMGIATPADKVVFCINLTIGQAAALSLLDADLGRFARSSRDIGIVAVIGNVIMNGVLVAIGGIIMFAGMPKLAAYYMQTSGMTSEAARQVALESADHVAIAFIVFGGAIGTGLMVLAQLKAQVVNTYSGSLSLANLFDVSIGWRPGRALFVIAINVVSFFFLFGDALTLFKDFLNLLGVVTTCLITIMLADYYGAQRLPPPFRCRPVTESVNVSGVAASIIGVAASFVDVPLIHAVPFVGTVIATAITYTAVRGFQGYVTFQKQARAAVETLPIA